MAPEGSPVLFVAVTTAVRWGIGPSISTSTLSTSCSATAQALASDIRTHPSDRRASPASASTGHTAADLCGQCSVFVSDRHASSTSHGMETA